MSTAPVLQQGQIRDLRTRLSRLSAPVTDAEAAVLQVCQRSGRPPRHVTIRICLDTDESTADVLASDRGVINVGGSCRDECGSQARLPARPGSPGDRVRRRHRPRTPRGDRTGNRYGAATTAGLSQTKSINAGKHWNGSRLNTPKGAAKRR